MLSYTIGIGVFLFWASILFRRDIARKIAPYFASVGRFMWWWLFWFRGHLAAVRLHNEAWNLAQKGAPYLGRRMEEVAISADRFFAVRLDVAFGRMTPEQYRAEI